MPTENYQSGSWFSTSKLASLVRFYKSSFLQLRKSAMGKHPWGSGSMNFGPCRTTFFKVLFRGQMDAVLVPLKIAVYASVEISLGPFSHTVYSKTLWSYTSPAIRKNLLDLEKNEHDGSPPHFRSVTEQTAGLHSSAKPMQSVPCVLHQAKGRLPSQPAFQLSTVVSDEQSNVALSYNVGTYPSGSNVRKNVKLGGSAIVSTDDLPVGSPLHFTITAVNSEGHSSSTQCSIPIYDVTPPTGRVEQSYDVSSHPNILSAAAFGHDDSSLSNMGRACLGLAAGDDSAVKWYDFSFNKTGFNSIAQGDLKLFSVPRIGRLDAKIVAQTTTDSQLACATYCLSKGQQCASFDYEHQSNDCRVLSTIESPGASLQVFGSYRHFERIGVGNSTFLVHHNLSLEHGQVYRFSIVISNALGYNTLLSSRGTLIDFTPPDPGPVGLALYDATVSDQGAACVVRCEYLTPLQNHRYSSVHSFFSCLLHGRCYLRIV